MTPEFKAFLVLKFIMLPSTLSTNVIGQWASCLSNWPARAVVLRYIVTKMDADATVVALYMFV